MRKRQEIFGHVGDKHCPAYQAVQEGTNDNLRKIRENCEIMWEDYWKYADSHFLSEFSKQFAPRWFEMYLSVALMRAGVEVKKTGQGMPDVFAEIDGRRIWIEAVCPGPGDKGLIASISCTRPMPCRDEGRRDKFILRVRGALKEKADKFTIYHDRGIVKKDDLAIVAIGFQRLDSSRFYYMCDWIHGAVYGKGNPQILINPVKRKVVGLGSEYKTSVMKPGTPIEINANCFKDNSLPGISGLLGSNISLAFPIEMLGSDFVKYPNPTSDVLMSCIELPLGKECGHTQNWLGCCAQI